MNKNTNKNKINFTFILNHLEVKCKLPIEIIPGHYFQKAISLQIKRIQEVLQNAYKLGTHPIPYEYKITKQKETSWSYKPLGQKDWKYYVIQFTGYNDKIKDLALVSNLGNAELKYGLTFLGTSTRITDPISIMNYIVGARPPETQIIKRQDIKELSNNYLRLKKIEKEFPDIKRSLEFFDSLDHLPKASIFQILGLFITIESLLTHRPDPKDPSDSLGRQIKTKIPLINNRADKPIDSPNYFKSVGGDNLWKKLYEYRSVIAHGGNVNFTDKLKILKDDKKVYRYLNEVTKMLLHQAINEPQLLQDLKKC